MTRLSAGEFVSPIARLHHRKQRVSQQVHSRPPAEATAGGYAFLKPPEQRTSESSLTRGTVVAAWRKAQKGRDGSTYPVVVFDFFYCPAIGARVVRVRGV
jgi:hypothetical protein